MVCQSLETFESLLNLVFENRFQFPFSSLDDGNFLKNMSNKREEKCDCIYSCLHTVRLTAAENN